MFAGVQSVQTFQLNSFFDFTKFLIFLRPITKTTDVMQHVDNKKLKKTDTFLLYFILFWTLSYFLYQRFLKSFLRRMFFPLIQRTRLVEATWNCGFCFGSLCYLMLLSHQTVNFAPGGSVISHRDLGILLYKSYFIHRAGVETLYQGNWVKGWAHVFFAFFILNPVQQKWCTMITEILFYKVINIATAEICKIFLCLSHDTGKFFAKLTFLLHCLCWTYTYLYFVPTTVLWLKEIQQFTVDIGLWLWFITECLDSVWLKIHGRIEFNQFIEKCLFPPPTEEAIELANIRQRHKDSLNKAVNCKSPKNNELWQTLLCAMAIKKKMKRMRQLKESERAKDVAEQEESQAGSEEETEEEDSELTTDSNETETQEKQRENVQHSLSSS